MNHVAEATQKLNTLSVISTRAQFGVNEAPTSVSVITKEEIEQKQGFQVKDLLKEELGMDVIQNGPPGTNTSVFMRGAGSSSTLVLVDGVQVNTNTVGSFNFADLTVDNIEKVEILRGPQSTLWGSDAVGGVINIITKKGTGAPTHSFSFEGGSFGTFKETGNSSGDLGFMDYSLSISRTDSEGFSAANEDRGNNEQDGYENTTLSTRLGRNFLEDGRVEFIGRYTKSQVDFDSFGPVDGKDFSKLDALYLAAPVQKSFFGIWDVKVNPTFAYDDLDSSNNSSTQSFIINRTYGVDVQNNVEITDFLSTTFGFEYEIRNGVNENSSLRQNIYNQGYYLQTQLHPGERIVLTAGFRHDVNSVFEDPTTYKFEGAYRILETNTRIRGAYATGFRAPSINELFFPNFGTPTLKPEESEGWEVGIDQSLLEGVVQVGVTYFQMDFDNLIETVDLGGFTFRAQNVAKATTEGVETAIDVALPKNFKVALNYTWLKARDDDDQPLQRRAEHSFSANLSHTWDKKLHSLVGVRVRSDTRSNNTGTQTADAFTVVRAALSYKVNKNLKVTARGENLFDEQYEEIFGFGTAGISGYAGFTWTFN